MPPGPNPAGLKFKSRTLGIPPGGPRASNSSELWIPAGEPVRIEHWYQAATVHCYAKLAFTPREGWDYTAVSQITGTGCGIAVVALGDGKAVFPKPVPVEAEHCR